MSFNAEMAALMAGMMGAPDVAAFGRSHRELVRELGKLDPVATAAAVAGLLTRRELRVNWLRLECLVSLAVRHGHGRRRPNRDFLSRAFRTLATGWAGRAEDPPEDVAVARVSGKRGSFAMFTGLAEGSQGHLERFLDIVDHMPDGHPWDDIREGVYSLLKLSDEVVRRSGGVMHELGATMRRREIPPEVLDTVAEGRKAVTFDAADLSALRIRPSWLTPFVFDPDRREEMDPDPLNGTLLERYPLLADAAGVVVALPTAISAAIRRMVIETCLASGMKASLERNLTKSYGSFLRRMNLLGGLCVAPFPVRSVGAISTSSFWVEIDDGRWLQLLAWVDDLEGYRLGNIGGMNPDPVGLGQVLMDGIRECATAVSKKGGFREGVTLLIYCGWGRGLVVALEDTPVNWRTAEVSSHDLQSLSDLPGMKPTYLWRLLDMRDEVKRRGIELLNPNGLLNLAAWARKNDEHVIPHEQLPPEFGRAGPTLVAIEQNALLDLRREAALASDHQRLPGPDGTLVSVERTVSRPVDGKYVPHYASAELSRAGVFACAVVTGVRVWWVRVNISDEDENGETIRHLQMLHHWLGEAAPVLEKRLPTLPSGTIVWTASFDGIVASFSPEERVPFEDDEPARVSAMLTSEVTGYTVHVGAAADFQRAYQHVSNLAERTLVRTFIAGTASLAGADLSDDDLDAIVAEIIPGPDARNIHAMHGRGHRDYVGVRLPSGFVEISAQDSALRKLGLAGTREGDGRITGKSECTRFLNEVVAETERNLCAALKEFARTPFLLEVVENHERAVRDGTQWRRTMRAVLALRRNSADAHRMVAEREGPRNAVLQSSRILLEAGLCECPVEGRSRVGEIDLSRLMVMANSIVTLGGWSNAIRWGAMEPSLTVSPLGDILTPSKFETDIVQPFGLASIRVRADSAAASYPRHYKASEAVPEVESSLEPRFVAAWSEEFSLSVDRTRAMLDALDDIGMASQVPALTLTRTKFLETLVEAGVDAADIAAFIRSFVLPARASWFDVPDGFLPRDREAWRFRRRLSVLRRPLLDLGGDELLVAPGMVREAVHYVLRCFHEGSFDKSAATSAAMRSWIGESTNRRGHAFNKEVRERLEELGWKAVSDVQMTALLHKGFERNYGDVDVLAWNVATGRVLMVECKDLHFPKTLGEIAEQLADFRGGLDEDGKRDLLRKHLDRHELALQHVEAVRRYTKMTVPPVIECHVVFRHPVPVTFAKGIAPSVRFSMLDDIATF